MAHIEAGGFLIHKYSLEIVGGPQFITMPLGAAILSVQLQRDAPCIWAVHQSGVTDTDDREFQVIGTGIEFTVLGTHIGTVQTGPFVWHVFEVTD
jgi:hypothetical protein